MWWQLFIVLVATATASEDEYEDYTLHEEYALNCMVRMHYECEREQEISPDFPGNGEQLEEFCKIALKYFNCTERIFSSCEADDQDNRRFVRETGAIVRRICKEDLLRRTAIAAILPCIKENLRTIGTCDETFSLDRESFTKIMKEIGVTDDEELDDSGRRCLHFLYLVGCTASTTGQLCGDVARDIVVNLMQEFDVPFELCPPGVKEKVPEIAEVMQMEAEKLESVENKLKKKK